MARQYTLALLFNSEVEKAIMEELILSEKPVIMAESFQQAKLLAYKQYDIEFPSRMPEIPKFLSEITHPFFQKLQFA